MEFHAMHGFIAANMRVGRALYHLPTARCWNAGVGIGFSCDMRLAIFARLLSTLLAPGARHDEIGCLIGPLAAGAGSQWISGHALPLFMAAGALVLVILVLRQGAFGAEQTAA